MGPAKRDILTDEEKNKQIQRQLEQELSNLKREYKILDQNQLQYQFTGGSKLAKINRVFSIFKHEHDNISVDLAIATAPERKRDDAKMFDNMSHLLCEYDFYDQRVKAEKTYMVEVEGQIKKVAKGVQQLRKCQINDRQHEELALNALKTLEKLENNLEVQMKKFNLICAKNNEMRSEIDHLLWQRRNFMGIWNKFIEKLVTGKKVMLDLIEQATLAYDQKEDWCNKLQTLRLKSHQDYLNNMLDMRELKRKENHARKLEQFFNIKGQKRVMEDLRKKESEKREKVKTKLHNKLIKYEMMMSEIREFTKESSIKVIAKQYCNREEENMMHFKFINQMISEMESVNDYLGYLHLETDEERMLHNVRDQQQQEKLKQLESELVEISKTTEETENEIEESEHNLNGMMTGIWHLFKICRCDLDPLLKLLGDHATIADYNVLLFLQILEEKVQGCLIEVGYRDKILSDRRKNSSDKKVLYNERVKSRIYSIERIVHATPCALCVEHEMVTDVFDVLQCAWDRKETKRKLAQRMMVPDGLVRVHNISKCHLPKARQMLQKRYE